MENKIDGKKFGFKKPDKDAISKAETQEEMLKSVQDAHDKALEDARKLLGDPKFKKVLKDYQVLEQRTIDMLINYSNMEVDPLKFAFGAKDLLGKIESIRALTVSIKTKAGK